ncbi:MAG: GNAT family N-acetyltransferase [Thermodesulfobacteriota bacterium]|nr:GNAT family N-acetyltransferase [Thermodesulfobacteriota bacterium]
MEQDLIQSIVKLSSRKFTLNHYTYYIFNNPSALFNAEQKNFLFNFTSDLIQNTFEKKEQSYFQARTRYFDEITQYWLVARDESPIGFCGIKQFKYQNTDVIYFDTLNVSKKHQANGIASIILFLSWIVNSWRTKSFIPFALRSQNPAVYKGLIPIVEPNILPEIDYVCEQGMRPKMLGLAKYVSDMLSKDRPVQYDEKHSVCRRAYGINLYGNNFKFPKKDSVSEYFNKVLDRDAGDTMMVVVWPRVTIYNLSRLFILMYAKVRKHRRSTGLFLRKRHNRLSLIK